MISGVRKLRGSRHTIMPDRIAGVTYLGAAAITGGTLCLRGVSTQPMENMLPVLEQTGCRVFPEPDRLHLLILTVSLARVSCGRCRFSVPCLTPVFPPMHRRSSWQC